MADCSLDDFFAKKDKKDKSKKKPKSKAGTGVGEGNNADISSTTSATSTKKEKRKDKDNTTSTRPVGTKTKVGSNGREDDDWNDFEEEKAVDYSGLRIQNLQIAKDEEAEGEEEEYDEDGEVKEKRDASGPWKKSGKTTEAPAPVEPPEAPKPKPEAAAPKVPGKYVPPGQRLSAANAQSPFPNSRGKRHAPNLKSQLDFPTLGGGFGPQDGTMSHIAVENAHHRGGANLTLENKFSALQD